MTKEDLEALFDRVRALPAEQQAEVVEFLDWIERRAQDVYVLSDEERAGVLRGLDDAVHRRFASKEEIAEVLGRPLPCAK